MAICVQVKQFASEMSSASSASGRSGRNFFFPDAIQTSWQMMENSEKFNGKSTTAFNQWWESVTMCLVFYPETLD